MRSYTDGQIIRLGAYSLAVMLILMAATFNLSKFPGFAGTNYSAEFADAGGLRAGNIVQIAGRRVGRVDELSLKGNVVTVRFEVDNEVEFGPETQASVEVLNLLGEKYLQISPAGEGQQAQGTPIPLDRTESAYDIVGVFGDLTRTTEQIDKDQLVQALDVVSETIDTSAPEIQASFDGLSRLSRTIASRDTEIRGLLKSSNEVSDLLADRSDDLVSLMDSSSLVFDEVQRRKEAISKLLVNARRLARELRGVATDNREQIGPALKEIDDLTSLLIRKEKELKDTLNAFGPYASILGNIIGTGPWFDAYAVNLAAIPTGEFVPVTQ